MPFPQHSASEGGTHEEEPSETVGNQQPAFIVAGLLALAAGHPAIANAEDDTYTWSAELVAVNQNARTVTVQSALVSDADVDFGRLEPGDRVTLTWSGLNTAAGVRRVSDGAAPAEVSVDATDRVRFRRDRRPLHSFHGARAEQRAREGGVVITRPVDYSELRRAAQRITRRRLPQCDRTTMSADWNRFVWSLLGTCTVAALAIVAINDAYAAPATVTATYTATTANMTPAGANLRVQILGGKTP